jgi:hypothetical protein
MKKTKEQIISEMQIYEQLHATAESAGLKILSDQKCCHILAWLYHFGGACEATVYDFKLNADIRTAQNRLNLHAGEYPNAALIPDLKHAFKELQNYLYQEAPMPEWLQQFIDEYQLSQSMHKI